MGGCDPRSVVAPGALDVDSVSFGEGAVAADDDEVFIVAGTGGGREVVAAGNHDRLARLLAEGVGDEDLRVDNRVADAALELLAGRLHRPRARGVTPAFWLHDIDSRRDVLVRGRADDCDLQLR